MKVRNNYSTHLGLGERRVLPDEVIDLSTLPGYDENHPVVKWYIARGWLVVVGKGNSRGKPATPVNVNTALNTGNNVDDGDGEGDDNELSDSTDNDDDNVDGDSEDGETNGTGSISSLANKNVDRLTLDELKTLAAEMKLEVVASDIRKTLIDKIKAAKKGEE